MNRIKFKEFVTLQRGFDLPRSQMVEGEYPVVGSTSIIGFHNEYKQDPPGVVTGRSGSLGIVQYITSKYWPHNTSLWVKDFKGNLPRYVYYLLKTLSLANYNAGAGVPTLNRNHLDNLDIGAHDLLDQHKVSAILSAYDDLIENNNRRIQILEEMAQRIYREWFVDFRFPGHEKAKFVNSEMGKIPEEWEVKRLGEVVELAYGKALKAEDRKDGKVPVFGSSGVVGYHNQALVKGPGIIVGRKGNVGSVFWSDTDFFPIDTVFYVQTKLSLAYIFFHLQGMNFINNDAAVPGLNRNQAYSLPCLVPEADILDAFQEIIMLIIKHRRLLTLKNDNLRKSRDVLLPKLISGEIDVSKMDIAIKEQMDDA